MIRVKKDFDKLSKILKSEACDKKIQQALREKTQHKFSQY